METKLYYVVTLVVAVLAPSALADCKTTKGDPFFNFQDLCGKVFTVAYSSSIGTTLSSIINWIECDQNNASLATMYTTIVTEGQKPEKQTYKFVYTGNGVIDRYYFKGDYWRTQIITSYSAFYDEKFKMGLLTFKDDDDIPIRRAVVSNYIADFTDELKILDIAAPDDSMTWLPNTFNPYAYIDYPVSE